jgi:hypothetical protein
LFEPFKQLLMQAPYFLQCRRQEDLQKEEKHFLETGDTSYIPWTSAAGMSSEIQFAGGNNYKLLSSE